MPIALTVKDGFVYSSMGSETFLYSARGEVRETREESRDGSSTTSPDRGGLINSGDVEGDGDFEGEGEGVEW